MIKRLYEGVVFGIGIFISFCVLLGIVYAVGFHSANEIIGGVFQGNYTFNGTMNFTPATVEGINTIDSGMIISFNSSACPSGYTLSSVGSGYTNDIVPTMTDNVTPSGVVSDSESPNSGTFTIFDDLDAERGLVATTGWFKYDFGAGISKLVTKYAITYGIDVAGRAPQNWIFEGSNDGSLWTTLDSQSSQCSWTSGQKKEYTFSNLVFYRHFRLTVTANCGTGSELHIRELEFMSPSSVTCIKN